MKKTNNERILEDSSQTVSEDKATGIDDITVEPIKAADENVEVVYVVLLLNFEWKVKNVMNVEKRLYSQFSKTKNRKEIVKTTEGELF